MNDNTVFIDTSAFLALYIENDDFHRQAIEALAQLRVISSSLITSNFILDESYTFIRARQGKKAALDFGQVLVNNSDIIKTVRITVNDENQAFDYFQTLDGRGISFTDCTSFALMKRLGIKNAFTFDRDFERAGFKIIP